VAYKITDAQFLSDKIKVSSFNLDSSEQTITQILAKNKEEKRILKKILKGKEQINHGRFLIDDMDLVNPSFVKRRTTFIKTDTYLERFIPPQFSLVVTTLLNAKLFRDFRLKSSQRKYDYLDFKKSGNNVTVAKLKEELDQIINEYTVKELEGEANKIADFTRHLLEFNERKAEELTSYDNLVLKVVAKSYADQLVQLNNYNLMLQFLQALYDDVYTFSNLRNSCTCEYNVNNSSNKILRRSKKELRYSETKYVVLKQLKYLGIRITEYRFKIFQQNQLINQLKKQLNIEITKQKQDSTRERERNLNNFLNAWKRVLNDQFDIFKQKQMNYLSKMLKNKSSIIARTLIIHIHTYHQKVLSQSIEFESLDDFKIAKKEAKSKLISVWNQAVEYNEKQLELYDIKIDWFLKSTFKLSSLNIVFMKILRAINLGKKNIVFTDFIKLFNQQDFEKLLAVLQNIKRKNPDFSFIMLQSQIEKFPELEGIMYMFNNNRFDRQYLKPQIDLHPEEYRKILFNNTGIKYHYDNDKIIISNQKYLWAHPSVELEKSGTFFVNPFAFKVQFHEPTEPNTIGLKVHKKRANGFNDPEMFFAKTKDGQHFYFYNNSDVEIQALDKVWVCFNIKEIRV